MAKRKSSNAARFFVWMLLGLLIIGLTGFGVRSVGNGNSLTVAAVGDVEINANSYARALTNEIQAVSSRFGTNLTLQQAQALGVDRQVLSQLLVTAALDGEVNLRGLSVGDDRVLERLLATEAFFGMSGAFDQTAYEFALNQANLSAPEYDALVRKEDARGLLQTAVVAGIGPDDTYARTLFTFLGETRSFDWTIVGTKAVVSKPTDDQLLTYYNANPDDFTAPLTRKITYIAMLPEQLAATVEVDEAELQDLYDSQSSRFIVPARRMVDRLVFGDQAAADLAMASLTDGSKSFEDAVTDRGLTLSDISLGAVVSGDLDADAREQVFALTEPGLVGPLPSAFGPAIYRVNAILAGQTTTLDQARDELTKALQAEAAVGLIDDAIGDIDDLLAGGATLEEIADETDMQLDRLDFTADSRDGIAANAEFRTEVAAVTTGDFPALIQMQNGGIFALQLNSVVEPALIPLSDVKPLVLVGWQAQEARAALLKEAERLKLLLISGGDFKNLELAVRPETNQRRDAFLDQAPADLLSSVFALNVNDVALVAGETSVVLARLTAIIPFAIDREDNRELIVNLQTQFSNQLAGDVFEAFAVALQDNAGVTVNQAVVGAVHRGMTGGTASTPTRSP